MGDFLHPAGSVSLFREEVQSTRADSTFLSSLSYWLLNDGQSSGSKPFTPSEIKAHKTATKCVKVSRFIFILLYVKTHILVNVEILEGSKQTLIILSLSEP